jgi:hypothetical protein
VWKNRLASANIGDHAVFFGGQDTSSMSPNKTVDAYDSSLVHTTPMQLSTARYDLGVASDGEYALVAGGFTGSQTLDIIDIYNSYLYRVGTSKLSGERQYPCPSNIGGYLLFIGGSDSNSTTGAVNIVDVFKHEAV